MNPEQNDKNYIMSYGFQKIQSHNIISDSFVIKMVIEDIQSAFFFRYSWAGKKNTANFAHSLLFEIFILKVCFLGIKQIRHLCYSIHQTLSPKGDIPLGMTRGVPLLECLSLTCLIPQRRHSLKE